MHKRIRLKIFFHIYLCVGESDRQREDIQGHRDKSRKTDRDTETKIGREKMSLLKGR